jgi:hypothetical protein
MNKKTLVWIVAAGIIAVAAFWLLRRPSAPSARGPTPAQVVAPPAPVAPETPAPLPAPAAPAPTSAAAAATVPAAPRVDTIVAKEGAEPIQVVRVHADQVLATVNSIPITLKDLVPLPPGDPHAERSMESDIYNARLDRAIEAELTFQAARSRNITLNDQQQQQLQRIRDRHSADIQTYRDQGLMWTSVTAEQIDFETRVTSALLLQQNLVAQTAGVSPHQPEYAEALRELLDHLRASANIAISKPER